MAVPESDRFGACAAAAARSIIFRPVEASAEADAFARCRSWLLASHGFLSGDNLSRLLESQGCGDYVNLARLIAANRLLAIRWSDDLWIPMFQFDLQDFSVRVGVGDVLAELASVLEARDLAVWFSTPHAGLDNRYPADVITSDGAAVVAASRATRLLMPRGGGARQNSAE